MPFNYKSPGVYVEEVDKGARPIESAGTAVLAMVGFCRDKINVELPGQTAPVPKATPTEPTLVTNWTQFVDTYGDLDQAVDGFFLHRAMYGYFLNGGTQAYVVGLPIKVEAKAAGAAQLPAGEAFLLNAAGQQTLRLTTAALKPQETITVEVKPAGEGAPENSINLVVNRSGAEPITVANLSMVKGKGLRFVADVLTKETDSLLMAEVLESSATLAERIPVVTAAPVALGVAEVTATTNTTALVLKDQITSALAKGNAAQRTGVAGLEAIEEVTLLAFPDAVAAFQYGLFSEDELKSIQTYMLNHCESMKDRFAILDCPAKMSVQDMIGWRKDRMNFDSKYGALYYPWIKADGAAMPPSGHIAGVYARVDGERGVHKAPANEVIRGVIGLEKNVSRNEQDMLNPIGVNCIRTFPGQGIRIWGARTLSSDAQWRYINVRRLFNNVEESILQGTNWIVFEPNDQLLWRQIVRDITSYLTVVWRSGALFGGTASQAFYVKCDEETNPKELRDLGYCIIEVGIAPVKPAEFVVFRISQKQDNAGTTAE
ncbi:MAG: phage tail sheath family protein [Anaerolineae bacterium]